MAKRVSADRWLFTVTLCLVFVGLVMVFSASAVIAKDRYGSGYTFLFRQLAWAVTGIVAMFVAMKLDYRRYNLPARSRNCHCVRRDYRLCVVCGGAKIAVSGLCFARVACAALFFDLPCRVPARPHSGIPRSLLGSAGTWISHYSITHRRQHWRHYRPGIDGGEAEAVLSSRAAH